MHKTYCGYDNYKVFKTTKTLYTKGLRDSPLFPQLEEEYFRKSWCQGKGVAYTRSSCGDLRILLNTLQRGVFIGAVERYQR